MACVNAPGPVMDTVAVPLILFPLILLAVLLRAPFDHEGEKEVPQFRVIWENKPLAVKSRQLPAMSKGLFISGYWMIRLLNVMGKHLVFVDPEK